MSSSDEEHVYPVCRSVRRIVNAAAIEAKRQRRIVMLQDGHTEWQMNRAEAQRVFDQVDDGEGVTQSVFRYANADAQTDEPEPEPMNERVKAMVEPVVLVTPHLRGFLPANSPGVTVCRPWGGTDAQRAEEGGNRPVPDEPGGIEDWAERDRVCRV